MWSSYLASSSGLELSMARRFAGESLLLGQLSALQWNFAWIAVVCFIGLFVLWLSVRHIPNNMIGVVEKDR